jgi:phosphotransferase system HPr (HPr) family protein
MILRRSHPTDKLIVVSRQITVQNELGLHARPAAEFVRVANRFRSEITLIKDKQRFSASSLIDVLRANLDKGASAMLEARGADAEAAITRLEKLLIEFRDRKED